MLTIINGITMKEDLCYLLFENTSWKEKTHIRKNWNEKLPTIKKQETSKEMFLVIYLEKGSGTD